MLDTRLAGAKQAREDICILSKKKNRLNPVTGQMTRWLIQTLNSGLSIQPSEVVEECMIEPTGFEIGDFADE